MRTKRLGKASFYSVRDLPPWRVLPLLSFGGKFTAKHFGDFHHVKVPSPGAHTIGKFDETNFGYICNVNISPGGCLTIAEIAKLLRK